MSLKILTLLGMMGVEAAVDKVVLPSNNGGYSNDYKWFSDDIARTWCKGTYRSRHGNPSNAMIAAKKVITDRIPVQLRI